jgi:hypothetical protein
LIRSVAPSDLWSLRRKPRSQVVLYNEAVLAQAHRPFWFALRCLLQGTGRERAMSVYSERSRKALVQAQGRYGRPELDILYLASHGNKYAGTPSDQDIWYRLLERLCYVAGQHHVQRLFASLASHQVEVREIFRQLGFGAYAHCHVLQLSGPDWDQGTALAPMRPQTRRDHWAIHKLYGATTPHLVQHAEVRNARTWALPLTQRWQGVRRRAWVLGPDDNLLAYVHLLNGTTGHVLNMLIRPDARDIAVEVIRFGLAQLTDTLPVYLMLREYHGEWLAPAQVLGFEPIGEQTLLLKNTVVPVRRPVFIPAFEPGLEPQVSAPHISAPREVANPYG